MNQIPGFPFNLHRSAGGFSGFGIAHREGENGLFVAAGNAVTGGDVSGQEGGVNHTSVQLKAIEALALLGVA